MQQFVNIAYGSLKGVFINTLVGGGGWAKWRGAKKVLSCQKGGTKKFSAVNGGVKKVWSNWKYNEN